MSDEINNEVSEPEGGEEFSAPSMLGNSEGTSEAEASSPAEEPQTEDETVEVGDNSATDEPPESYGDFDFGDMVVPNEEVLGQFKALAKELKLSQDTAQKFVDMQARLTRLQIEDMQRFVVNQNKEWEASVRNDPDMGGKKLPETLSAARKALTVFPEGEQVKSLLEQRGLGNHPAVIRFLSSIGAAISSDRASIDPKGGLAPKSEQDREEARLRALFPTTFKS